MDQDQARTGTPLDCIPDSELQLSASYQGKYQGRTARGSTPVVKALGETTHIRGSAIYSQVHANGHGSRIRQYFFLRTWNQHTTPCTSVKNRPS
ncbi:hypothetical protein BDV98DRAFT_592354 [Pterulicium gracile]|uniref:Uncharacterized protein n=1 Tax=Pterulicium gracile TaxID=1884261 RepID=A0A5C3QQA4_9AGAR|nr:hypothetical protein BDV98DRAFT_592354 [Pterula gracilis]